MGNSLLTRIAVLWCTTIGFTSVCLAQLTEATVSPVMTEPEFNIMGFGDISYVSKDGNNGDGFVIGQAVAHLTASLGDSFAVFGEFSLTGKDSEYSVEAERLMVKYDAAPFNKGLRHVLSKRQEVSTIKSVTQFVNMIESYNSVVLRSTAWETALATGSLGKMDYSLVSALSLTYGLQGRYQELNRTDFDMCSASVRKSVLSSL